MDHEQNFCPGNSYWTGGCTSNHFGLDFANYLIYESQAMAKIANLIGLPERAMYWKALATNVTNEMDELMWDEESGFYYDMWFNGTLMHGARIGVYSSAKATDESVLAVIVPSTRGGLKRQAHKRTRVSTEICSRACYWDS
jgi:hypothetical protein